MESEGHQAGSLRRHQNSPERTAFRIRSGTVFARRACRCPVEASEHCECVRGGHPQPVQYKGIRLDCGYRLDVLVENKLSVERKSVDEIKRIHEAQLLTYMKLAEVKIGLLMNFNVTTLKDGIKRLVL
ncbi:MAG: hypothetical protein CMJ50_06130 [Planctomycetaceae bacterium]|nr:hypothetical protein [Planctomycetaceae bacterium]